MISPRIHVASSAKTARAVRSLPYGFHAEGQFLPGTLAPVFLGLALFLLSVLAGCSKEAQSIESKASAASPSAAPGAPRPLAVTDTVVTVGQLHSATGTMAISETGSIQAERLAIDQI